MTTLFDSIWRRRLRMNALVALAVLFIGHGVLAQEGDTGDETTPTEATLPAREAYNSPRATMFTYLETINLYLNDQNVNRNALDRATECLDLSLVAEERAEILATQLLDILNRMGEVQLGHLPDAKFVGEKSLDSFSFYPRDLSTSTRFARPPFEKRDNYAFLPVFEEVYPGGRIELVHLPNGEWKFSADTVAGIDNFHRRVEDLPVLFGVDVRSHSFPLWLRSQVPRTLRQKEFLTLEYWQWIGLLILVFIGVVLDLFVRLIVAGITRRIIAKQRGKAQKETIKRMVRPFGLVVAGLFWLWAIHALNLPDAAFKILLVAARFVAMVAAVWSAYRLADLGGEVLASKAARTATKFDDLLVPLVRKTVKLFITAFGLIYIADAMHIEILPLLTGLGIGGAAIAFASKDTVENFFGSIAVIIDRPFEVGDWVEINGIEGNVETMGFRSTRIRTFYNSLVTVPNANLVRATVDNFGQRKYRRFKTHLGITYDTSPDKIEAFCEGIREIVRLHPYTRKDYYQVWLHQFGPSSLDILLYVFHESPDWTTELRERQRLMTDIIRLADRLGVEFAFPTQTLHLHQTPEEMTHQPAPSPRRKAASDAEQVGRRAVQDLIRHAPWVEEKPTPYQFTHSNPVTNDEEDSQIESRGGGDG